MNRARRASVIGTALLCPLILMVFGSCGQYDYTNPLPGIAQINLQAKYTPEFFDTAFTLNNFTLKVTQIQALRADGARANIYTDPKAIGIPPVVYNTFGKLAYEGTMIIGQYQLPPGDYIGLNLLIEPGTIVILDGYRQIRVERDPDTYSAFVGLRSPFTIQESRTTKVLLTLDLDLTLQKRAYTYVYNPHFTIASVEVL